MNQLILNLSKPTLAGAPPPPAAQPQKRETGDVQIDSVINSATVNKILTDGIKGGDKVTITGANGQVVEITKKQVSAFDKVRIAATDMFRVTSAEVSNIVAQDPAFAFKEAAFAVQTQVFAGIPEGLTAVAAQGFLPMVRVVSLALDLKKAHETWKNEASTHVDKAIVGGHLVTDIAGIGGAVALAVPALGPAVGVTLSAIGMMGDVAAYAYHVMKYFRDRGAPVPPSDPLPDPNPPPVDPTPPPADPNPPVPPPADPGTPTNP